MNTEDKFYFGKHGQPERFGWDTRSVNSQAKRMLSALDRTKPQEGYEQFRNKLRDRLVQIVKSTDELIRNPTLEEQVGGWEMDDLTRSIDETINRSASLRRYAGSILGHFSRPGQPERFANLEGNYAKIEARYSFPDGTTDTELMSGSAKSAVASAVKKITARGNGAKAWVIAFTPANPRTGFPAHKRDLWKGEVIDGRAYERGGMFSRPGQPERFAANKQSAIQVTDAEYAALVAADAEMEQWVKYQHDRTPQQKAIRDAGKSAMDSARARLNATHKKWEAASSDAERAQIEKQYVASGRSYKSKHFFRPCQPDKFDASSLNRGNFAAASSSPMLGKLLSEKQMPEGGWRAVETGGGSLVISFEDGDVAGNFARRVASNGYSATAPVQSIGRYWNVEVKNG
jgi:hypothetical protein